MYQPSTGRIPAHYVPKLTRGIARVMTPEQLETLGLLAPTEPVHAPPLKLTRDARNRPGKERQWPSYEMALASAPPNQHGSGPDRSLADFWFCYLALQRGRSAEEETEAKLLEVSQRARERVRLGDPGYVHVTVKNAAEYLERSRHPRARCSGWSKREVLNLDQVALGATP
ncbi:MAG: hypothetical protein ACRD3T_01890 [Terriglobia bacterium]